MTPRASRRQQIGIGAAIVLALGVAGGAGAVELTRPAIEMAPVQPVAIASLSSRTGPVTVKGKVAEVYGDRFTIADGSGKTMVDAGGPGGRQLVTAGQPVMVQGRYDDGQLRASYLVDGQGDVQPIGPAGPPPPPHGRRGGPDGPPPPPPPGAGPRGGPGAPPPPPGCVAGPAGPGAGTPLPPPVGADGQAPPPPTANGQPPRTAGGVAPLPPQNAN
ncbi:hypothetical protein EAH79_12450 [Sphingomonas koreensis]|nr:hypothetical protein EAH79_12450 [Sphingomonas koreensis]